MGQEVLPRHADAEAERAFSRALLRDLQALDRMLAGGLIETGVRRIGAEQEMFLVNEAWRPAPIAMQMLESLDRSFTNELALFNLEANVEPMVLEGACFGALERRLTELVSQARAAAQRLGCEVLLAGILPTLTKSDLSLENITPLERYRALNDALSRMRGGEPQTLRIEGPDELFIQHDSVMLEACNTSCQVHLQVDPDEFAHVYNAAQLVTGPVLAGSVNSPVLMGRRLWAETRIALFQQSVDTRRGVLHMREVAPRVRFGEQWVEGSVTELFHEDLVRFRALLTRAVDEDPLACLREGGIPSLQALQLYNGTVYRWNRPCYGIHDGRPHLRIECRALPAGPTVVDETVNAALWIGAVLGAAARYPDLTDRVDFDEVRSNFVAASRLGLKAGFRWLDGRTVSASDLLSEEVIPIAREGLEAAGVAPDDIERYLSIASERVHSGVTGAGWTVRSLTAMKDHGTRAERLAAVTAGSVARQRDGTPAHLWTEADVSESGGWRLHYMTVEQFMTTSLFTVNEDEPVHMAAFLMDRKHIRHVLVEDAAHKLVGLVSYRSVLRVLADGFDPSTDALPTVGAIMERDPLSVAPETPTLEAIDLLRKHKVSCLPVVSDGKLVGIVSERDFLPVAYELLGERLGGA